MGGPSVDEARRKKKAGGQAKRRGARPPGPPARYGPAMAYDYLASELLKSELTYLKCYIPNRHHHIPGAHHLLDYNFLSILHLLIASYIEFCRSVF